MGRKKAEELLVYSDESVGRGRYYSNFYGALLVRGSDLVEANERLAEARRRENVYYEIHWNKVSKVYWRKYASIIDVLFDLVSEGKVKTRIVFTKNSAVPCSLSPQEEADAYLNLYYYFLKHAFGIAYCNPTGAPLRISFHPDDPPARANQIMAFRKRLLELSKCDEYRDANVRVSPGGVAFVDSKNVDLLQCLDVVLGAMQFRLNDEHEKRVNGRRPNKTAAKYNLYRHIVRRIRTFHPNFNISVSTDRGADRTGAWHLPHRHWVFRAKKRRYDAGRTKKSLKAPRPLPPDM